VSWFQKIKKCKTRTCLKFPHDLRSMYASIFKLLLLFCDAVRTLLVELQDFNFFCPQTSRYGNQYFKKTWKFEPGLWVYAMKYETATLTVNSSIFISNQISTVTNFHKKKIRQSQWVISCFFANSQNRHFFLNVTRVKLVSEKHNSVHSNSFLKLSFLRNEQINFSWQQWLMVIHAKIQESAFGS